MAADRLRRRGRVALFATLALIAVALLAMTGFGVDLLILSPALTTAAILLAWPEPGIELILRIAARRRRPRRASPCAPRRRRRPAPIRGGRLIAASLGGRAPPGLLACS